MKILVTGGAGFIGSHLVDRFVAEGATVSVIDDLSTGKEKNIHPSAHFYKADITSSDLWKIFEKEKPDVVSHHAAQVSVAKSVQDPLFDAKINILGTICLLQQCVNFNVQRVMFASSGGAIYREPKTTLPSERGIVDPLSGYGIGKFASDLYLKYFLRIYKLNFTSLRYANIYGPRQDPLGEGGVVSIFVETLLQGKSPTVNGSGKQTRDFVFVNDAVEANWLALQQNAQGVFNVGTAKETSVNQLYRHIATLINSAIKPTFGPAKQGEAMKSVLDASRIQRLLGWQPSVSIKEGLRLTIDAFKRDRTH